MTVSVHTHTDTRPTFGCDACIESLTGKHPPPRDAEELSAGQRLTLRNQKQLARGIHPATLQRLSDNGQTCGTCNHHHNGRFHKCELHRLGESHSAASDIRVSWPACTAWEAVTS